MKNNILVSFNNFNEIKIQELDIILNGELNFKQYNYFQNQFIEKISEKTNLDIRSINNIQNNSIL